MSSDPSDQNSAAGAAQNEPQHHYTDTTSTSSILAGPESEQDSYLHPISLLFSLISQVKSNLIPAVFGVVGATNGNLFYIFLALIFLVPSLLISIVRYFTVRYRISGGELVVNEGLFFRRTRTVPVEQIQNIDLVQGVLHRIFKVAEVRVETASGTKPEAVLSVLSLSQVELLRRDVFHQKTADPHLDSPNSSTTLSSHLASAGSKELGGIRSESIYENNKESSDQLQDSTILRIPLSWLAKAGFASNRGLIMVGILLGLYFQFDRPRGQEYDFSFLTQWLPDLGNFYVTTAAVLTACIVGLLLMRLLGVAWYILRFFGYRLSLSGDDFKISCGLFTKVSATVPRKRIQFISVHSNFISRLLGLSSIRIETAGGASSQNENATTTVSRRWFVPVLPTDDVEHMLSILRPGLQWQPDQYAWKPLSPKASQRMVRIAVFVSLLLAPIGYFSLGIWGLTLTLIALPVLVTYAIKKSQTVAFARTAFGVVYRSGILTRKISLTFFEKIQSTAITQTPFDRRWGMATLSVDTAAAGPADHAIEIKYLDVDLARGEHWEILQASAER